MEDNVVVGGLLNGKYRAGLNGCQQKLLLFEMLYQQTASQSKLSLALDEPFEMVSTEYLPFVIDRLNSLRERHHVVISTCDHIRALSEVADITLGVNPFNPHVVKVNNREYVDREEAIMALSVFDRRAKYYIDDEPAVDSGGATTAEGHSNREYHEAQRDATVTPETLEQEPMAMEVSGLTADLTNEVTVTDLDPAVLDYIEPQPECVELY